MRARIITPEPVARVVVGQRKVTAPMARLLRTPLPRFTGKSPPRLSANTTIQPHSWSILRPAIPSPLPDPLEAILLLRVFEGSAPVFHSARLPLPPH